MIKNLPQNRLVKFWLGFAIIIIGTVLQFTDWGSGENPLHGGYFTIPILIISGLGAFLLIDLKYNDRIISGNYAILYPIIIAFLLNGYTYFHVIPRIKKQGLKTKGVVTKVYNKTWGDVSFDRGIYYKYEVGNKSYVKSDFSEKLNIGDSINIRYFEGNPNFHLSDLE